MLQLTNLLNSSRVDAKVKSTLREFQSGKTSEKGNGKIKKKIGKS